MKGKKYKAMSISKKLIIFTLSIFLLSANMFRGFRWSDPAPTACKAKCPRHPPACPASGGSHPPRFRCALHAASG